MAKNLVIVESPTKAKIITKFLWKDYKVMSSNWHIRDLPAKKGDMTPKQAALPYSTLAVDIENDFDMIFVQTPAKKKIIKAMKDQVEPDTVLWLASDEDREWEAISWHLLETLDPKRKLKNKRVVFHEITKWAIQEAFKHTRELDTDLVDAQMARRVLDRIVWYKLSPLLWKKIKFWLSAWRVQSPCVRILVDREREIQAFIPEEYWSIWSFFNKDKIDFESKFFTDLEIVKDWKKLELKNSDDTKKILEKLNQNWFFNISLWLSDEIENELAWFNWQWWFIEHRTFDIWWIFWSINIWESSEARWPYNFEIPIRISNWKKQKEWQKEEFAKNIEVEKIEEILDK